MRYPFRLQIGFRRYSRNRNGGVLNIQNSIGHVTRAGLFSVNDTGLRMLRKRGVPNKYEEKEIVVIDNEGNEILARTYSEARPKRKICCSKCRIS